jgi:hypothetical protein
VKLIYSTGEFLAIELQETMAGLVGIDDASLIEILMSRSNQELAFARDFYQNGKLKMEGVRQEGKCTVSVIIYILFNLDFGHSLISDIQKKTKGSHQELLVLLAQV